MRKERGYWTKERVFEESKKYKIKNEFITYSNSAYGVARKNGWLAEMIWFEKPKPHNLKWTKEKVIEESKKYQTKTEFAKHCSRGYEQSLQNGWINEMTWLIPQKKVQGYWDNKINVFEESKKYSSRTEFEKGCNSAYQKARINGWLDEMEWLKPKDDKFLNGHYVYAYIDEENKCVYIGRTCDPKNRHSQHKEKNNKSSVRLYFERLNKPIPNPLYLEKNISLRQSQIKEHEWLQKYISNGYTALNKAKTGLGIGSIGSYEKKWTKNKVFNEGKKYTTKADFYRNSSRAYEVARKNGWLKEMTWFVTPKRKIKWAKEKVFRESKKYKTKTEFERKNSRCYTLSLQNDWLKEMTWFKSIKKTNGYWTKEKVIEEGKKYKCAKDFIKGCSGAYNSAVKNKWTKEIIYKK